MSGDRYAEWDAAYVLGSLSAAERQEYEDHVAECASCRAAVAELAGMPGLLAQVPAHEALALGDLDEGVLRTQPPVSLMPPLPREEPARRRSWVAPAAAAAAALVIGGLGGYTLSGSGSGSGPGAGPGRPTVSASTTGPSRLAFSPVGYSAMTAVVDLIPSGSGTRVQVECQYSLNGAPGYDPKGAYAEYSVWVVDLRGHAELGTTWTARPNRVMRPSAQSGLAPGEIAAVEIRRVDNGQTVMRADHA